MSRRQERKGPDKRRRGRHLPEGNVQERHPFFFKASMELSLTESLFLPCITRSQLVRKHGIVW